MKLNISTATTTNRHGDSSHGRCAIAWTAAEQLHHTVADDLGEMLVRAVLLRDPAALAGRVLVVVVEHVEHPCQGRNVPRHRELSVGVDAELADHPGVVAGVAQQPGVADVAGEPAEPNQEPLSRKAVMPAWAALPSSE